MTGNMIPHVGYGVLSFQGFFTLLTLCTHYPILSDTAGVVISMINEQIWCSLFVVHD